MNVVTYKVSCTNCKQSDLVKIADDSNIFWENNTYIISGRKRLDGLWGFQCFCGNNSLLTDQESKTIRDLANPDPQDIQNVLSNLIVQDDKKFVINKV